MRKACRLKHVLYKSHFCKLCEIIQQIKFRLWREFHNQPVDLTYFTIWNCRLLVHLVRRLFTIILMLTFVTTPRLASMCSVSLFVLGDDLTMVSEDGRDFCAVWTVLFDVSTSHVLWSTGTKTRPMRDCATFLPTETAGSLNAFLCDPAFVPASGLDRCRTRSWSLSGTSRSDLKARVVWQWSVWNSIGLCNVGSQ